MKIEKMKQSLNSKTGKDVEAPAITITTAMVDTIVKPGGESIGEATDKLLAAGRRQQHIKDANRLLQLMRKNNVPAELRQQVKGKLLLMLKNLGASFIKVVVQMLSGDPNGSLGRWPLHIPALDKAIGGLGPGLTLIVGGPGVGKSSICLCIILIQLFLGRKVFVIDLENGMVRWLGRACAQLGVASQKERLADPGLLKSNPDVFSGFMTMITGMTAGLKYLSSDNLQPLAHIWDETTFIKTVFDISPAKLDASDDEFVLLVDSLQKLPSPFREPTIRLGHISRVLESLGQRPNVRVLGVAELRKCDKPKVVTLQDLRDSFSLPYAANEVYAIVPSEDAISDADDKERQAVDFISLKQRDGLHQIKPATLHYDCVEERMVEMPKLDKLLKVIKGIAPTTSSEPVLTQYKTSKKKEGSSVKPRKVTKPTTNLLKKKGKVKKRGTLRKSTTTTTTSTTVTSATLPTDSESSTDGVGKLLNSVHSSSLKSSSDQDEPDSKTKNIEHAGNKDTTNPTPEAFYTDPPEASSIFDDNTIDDNDNDNNDWDDDNDNDNKDWDE